MVRLFGKLFSRLNEAQAGATSLYLSLIIMVILSLIAFGFAQIAGSSYKQIAESQSNLQAHYASESAINQVKAEIHNNIRRTSQVADSDELSVERTSANHFLHNAAGRFASAVFASSDLLIVGAAAANGGQGEVYIYEKTGADWHGAAVDRTIGGATAGVTLAAGDEFGASVFLGSGQLIVGAPGMAERSTFFHRKVLSGEKLRRPRPAPGRLSARRSPCKKVRAARCACWLVPPVITRSTFFL